MPLKGKRAVISVWPRKYHTALTSDGARAIELLNLRALFWMCVERRTPEVIEHPAHDVLPPYRKAFYSGAEAEGRAALLMMDNRTTHHGYIAEAWFNDHIANTVWWDRYPEVRVSLLAWTEKYQIKSEWVLKMALDALLEWTWRGTTFSKFQLPSRSEIEEYVAGLTPELQKEFLEEIRQIRESRIEWPMRAVTPETFKLGEDELKVFKYPAWDGLDELEYANFVRGKFENHLGTYLASIREQAKKLETAKPVIRPERFEMLALYLCRDMSPGAIAKESGFHKSSTAIFRDVQSAAKLIDLRTKHRGRKHRKRQNCV